MRLQPHLVYQENSGTIHFYNSENGKVCGILAIILNLPPLIRQAFLNIVPILFWQGQVIDNFNKIFELHLQELANILKNGIIVRIASCDLVVAVYIHLLFGDSPARAKIANSKQFNGLSKLVTLT